MIKAVFSDFDGTLTLHDKINPLLFTLISYLENKNIPLIITTGRGLSWAYFLLTYITPLKIVIAEGGGVIAINNNEGRIIPHYMASATDREKLKKFCLRLQDEHPTISLALDSIGRVTDRAIDLDDYLSYPQKEAFDQLLQQEQVASSISNVHLNFWCGHFSKYQASCYVLKEYLQLDNTDAIYFGDSCNDESMFQHFHQSVGVSNINAILHKLHYVPKTILKGEENREIKGVLNYLQQRLG